MERHQIRRVPAVDDDERCVGIIAQADLAWAAQRKDVAGVCGRAPRRWPGGVRAENGSQAEHEKGMSYSPRWADSCRT